MTSEGAVPARRTGSHRTALQGRTFSYGQHRPGHPGLQTGGAPPHQGVKALSDGTRQEILRLLEGQQRTVGEIVGNFSLSQPTISRHLSVLKEADLVVDQRHGQNVIYRLNDDALSTSMQEFFGQFRSCQEVMR